MKLIIRIIWFVITFALYLPIRNTLDVAGTKGLIVTIFHWVYLLFVFWIPSNAFIAMYQNRPKQKVKLLCKYIWREVSIFSKKHGLSWNECTSVYLWTAFYYAILDIIEAHSLNVAMKQQLLTTGVKIFTPTSRLSATMVESQIEYGFDEMFFKFEKERLNPLSSEGLVDIFQITMIECVGNPLAYTDCFNDFAKSLLNVTTYAANLLPNH